MAEQSTYMQEMKGFFLLNDNFTIIDNNQVKSVTGLLQERVLGDYLVKYLRKKYDINSTFDTHL